MGAVASEAATASEPVKQEDAAPSGPWGVYSSQPSVAAAPSRILGPGTRRDHTKEFQELRALYNERHRERAGPRLPWLLRIIDQGDAQELSKFVEVARASQRKGQPDGGCAWCNARIALRPTPPQTAKGFQVAKECELCLAWHCAPCCSSFVSLGAEQASRRSSRSIGIECCDPCRRLFDVLLWQQESPPQGLTESSAKLLATHRDIAAGLTSFACGLAQLEGLMRIGELEATEHQSPAGHEGDSPARVRAECQQALATSQASIATAKKMIAIALRQVSDLVCRTPGKDSKVQEALIRHGKVTLSDLECRLWAAELRLAKSGLDVPQPRVPPRRSSFG